MPQGFGMQARQWDKAFVLPQVQEFESLGEQTKKRKNNIKV